jgi:hypothetical protein
MPDVVCEVPGAAKDVPVAAKGMPDAVCEVPRAANDVPVAVKAVGVVEVPDIMS